MTAALATLTGVWAALLAVRGLALVVGAGAPPTIALGFGLIAVWIATTRGPGAPPLRVLDWGVGLVAGWAVAPVCGALVVATGSALGLAPRTVPGASCDAAAWLAAVAFAPVFEELLYREQLLFALRARLGAPLACVLSCVAFAAPHLEPWTILGCLWMGAALAGLMLALRSVALCIGVHAGVNAALLAHGAALSTHPFAGFP